MQRRRVQKDPHTGQYRQQHAACQSKGMEEGQCIEYQVSRAEIDPGGYLETIGLQVGMAEHHAFGYVFRSGSEQDDCRCIRITPGMGIAITDSRQQACYQPCQFVPPVHLMFQIFQIDQCDLLCFQTVGQSGQFGGFDESACSDDGPDLCYLAGCHEISGADRKI